MSAVDLDPSRDNAVAKNIGDFLNDVMFGDGTLRVSAVQAALGGSQFAPKQTVVIFGDSITANNKNGSAGVAQYGSSDATGYWTHAAIKLRHRFTLLANAGVGGDRTANMLARIQSDVIAYSPGWVIVQGAGNDVTNAVTSATTIANLQAIYTALLVKGYIVVATTVLPSTSMDTAAEKANFYAVNAWIRGYATTTPGMILCDWAPAVQDPTGTITLAALTSDGIHPNQAGAYLLGQALYNTLQGITPLADPLPWSPDENANALPNPRMTGDVAGVATSTTISGLSGTPTLTTTKVARTDGIQGEWQQVVIASATDGTRVQQQAASNVGGAYFSVGDIIYATCEVELDSGATMVGKAGEVPVQLALINQDGANAGTIYDVFNSTGAGTYSGGIPSGRLVLRTPNYVIPSGANRLFVRAIFYVNGTGRVGRMQLYKTSATTLEG